jgi:c-di-GMP-binding flagellar brake protein YcgR
MTESGAERRLAARKIIRTRATVVLSGKFTFEVRTLDISVGGMCIVAAANPIPGTPMQISCQIPVTGMGPVQIEAHAKVMHSVFSGDEEGFKIGLSFTEISPQCKDAIAKFVR